MAPRRTVESRGLRFTLRCENWITQYRWQTYNEKEPETLDWIDQRLGEGDVLFDIGANIGVYTLYAALRHPGVRVVAFEPEYSNLHLLRDNLVANGLQDRVEVYALALSDRTGVSQLHLQDLAPGSALHTESRDRLDRTFAGRAVVWREGIAVMTLDAFCDETGLSPQALKIDVDGSEPGVLAGARRTLASTALRSVILEMPDDASTRAACEQQLTTAGLARDRREPSKQGANDIWVRRA